MKLCHYQVILNKLKRLGIIVNGKINQKFIPNVEEDGDSFKLLLLFEFNDTK